MTGLTIYGLSADGNLLIYKQRHDGNMFTEDYIPDNKEMVVNRQLEFIIEDFHNSFFKKTEGVGSIGFSKLIKIDLKDSPDKALINELFEKKDVLSIWRYTKRNCIKADTAYDCEYDDYLVLADWSGENKSVISSIDYHNFEYETIL